MAIAPTSMDNDDYEESMKVLGIQHEYNGEDTIFVPAKDLDFYERVEYCDRYEETLGFDNRTYRACPGYGDFPLEFNKRIAILLDIPRKIGVTITPNNLLIPQKSMLGLIGIGSDKRKKSCGNCVMKEDCPFRKRGQRCYRTD